MVSDPFIIFPLYALSTLLIFAGICDIRTRIIENWVSYAVALLALPWWWANNLALWPDMAIQIGLMLAVFAFCCFWFAIGQMGGADVKLASALALWIPLHEQLMVWLVMSAVGGVLTIFAFIEHKVRKKQGPVETPYAVAIAFAGLWWVYQTIS